MLTALAAWPKAGAGMKTATAKAESRNTTTQLVLWEANIDTGLDGTKNP
jgi:hypothetical protein